MSSLDSSSFARICYSKFWHLLWKSLIFSARESLSERIKWYSELSFWILASSFAFSISRSSILVSFWVSIAGSIVGTSSFTTIMSSSSRSCRYLSNSAYVSLICSSRLVRSLSHSTLLSDSYYWHLWSSSICFFLRSLISNLSSSIRLSLSDI